MANRKQMAWKQHRTPSTAAEIERDMIEAGLIPVPTWAEEMADEPTEGCPFCVEQGRRCVCCQGTTAEGITRAEADFAREVWEWEAVERWGSLEAAEDAMYDDCMYKWRERQEYAAECEIEALAASGAALSLQARQAAREALERADWEGEYLMALGELQTA
jgi:hypothetical protein